MGWDLRWKLKKIIYPTWWDKGLQIKKQKEGQCSWIQGSRMTPDLAGDAQISWTPMTEPCTLQGPGPGQGCAQTPVWTLLMACLWWRVEECHVLHCGLVPYRAPVLSQNFNCLSTELEKILLRCCGNACGYCRDGRNSCVMWGWAGTSFTIFTCDCPANFHHLPRFTSHCCKLAVIDLARAMFPLLNIVVSILMCKWIFYTPCTPEL